MGNRSRRIRREPLFPISMWNHYDAVLNDLPRTNNAIEGWHHAFNARAGGCHISIWKLINLMKTEQGVTEVALTQLGAGREAPPRKKKYRDLDARLKNIVSEFDGSNYIEYLTRLSHVISL